MYIKVATSIMAIYTVTTNAAESGTAKEADTSTELFKRLSPDTLSEMMEHLDPQSLRSLSAVDTSIRKQVTSEMQQRQKDLDVSPMFAPALQILGLEYNPEQFVRDFPWHNFNNPQELDHQGNRFIPFPKEMCSRCRGIYGGRPTLVIQQYKTLNQQDSYLLVRFGSDKDSFGSYVLDMAALCKSLPMEGGQFPSKIKREQQEVVLRKSYRESKYSDVLANPGEAEDYIFMYCIDTDHE